MVKVYLALAAVLLLSLGSNWALFRGLQTARAERGAMELQVQEVSARMDALQARQAGINKAVQGLQQRSSKNEAQISKALREVPDWSNSPVPDPVSVGLCGFLTCDPR